MAESDKKLISRWDSEGELV